ncbi:hypothetical protein GH714_014915 [Hevea brasiliensis]|uniref:Uncharacterized protein n=1 Tax=Hevea brasiliensis TaxID=3981 RepID=A0A6A6KNU9_HEVBR|nr:hypothetical protein GH714_014915 [Hevea brasiliensis]
MGDLIAARQRELSARGFADDQLYNVSWLPEDSDLDQEIEDEMTEELDELEELMIEYRSGLAGAVIEAHMKQQRENYADYEDLGKLTVGITSL